MSVVHCQLQLTAPVGPVHFNVPFREPLLIDFDRETPKSTFQKRFKGADSLDASTAQQISHLLATSEKGFIIAGEMPIGFDKTAFWNFAKALEWPVLCDPLSNLRTEVPEQCLALCIDHYDALLKSDSIQRESRT